MAHSVSESNGENLWTTPSNITQTRYVCPGCSHVFYSGNFLSAGSNGNLNGPMGSCTWTANSGRNSVTTDKRFTPIPAPHETLMRAMHAIQFDGMDLLLNGASFSPWNADEENALYHYWRLRSQGKHPSDSTISAAFLTQFLKRIGRKGSERSSSKVPADGRWVIIQPHTAFVQPCKVEIARLFSNNRLNTPVPSYPEPDIDLCARTSGLHAAFADAELFFVRYGVSQASADQRTRCLLILVRAQGCCRLFSRALLMRRRLQGR